MPIFRVTFPGVAALLFGQMFKIANFDLIDISDFMTDFFELSKDDEAYSYEFKQVGIEAKNLIMSSGLLLITLSSIGPILIIASILGLVKLFMNGKCFLKCFEKFKEVFLFSFYIRVLLEGAL